MPPKFNLLKGDPEMYRARLSSLVIVAAVCLLAVFVGSTHAQRQKPVSTPKSEQIAVDSPSEMRAIIERYVADRGSLQRSFFVANSPARRERFRKFYSDALDGIQKLDFDSMD